MDLHGQKKIDFGDGSAPASARDYQVGVRDMVLDRLAECGQSLVVCATGLGKTFIFCMLCMLRRYNRIMVVCCRKTINKQNAAAVAFHCDHPIDSEEAEFWANEDFPNRVVIASSATLTAGDRGRRFTPDLVIVDECHRLGPDMIALLDEYKEKGAHVVGFTATANRNNKGWAPAAVFGEPTVSLDIRYGVDNGWLVPVMAKRVTLDKVDYSKAIKGSRLDLDEVLKAIGFESVMQQQAGAVAECLTPGRKEIVFCVNIAHCEKIAEILQRKGVKCTAYHSKQSVEERRVLMRQFREGDIDVICCAYTLSMGFDMPLVTAVHHLAPLTSTSEYCQRCGRCIRPLENVVTGRMSRDERRAAIAKSDKPFCYIFDYVDITRAHQLVNARDLMMPDIRTPRQRANDDMLDGEQPINLGAAEDDAKELEKEELRQAALEMENEKQRRKDLVASIGVKLEDADPYLGAVDGSVKKREARIIFGTWFVNGTKQNMKGLPVRLAPLDFLAHHRRMITKSGKYKWLLPAIDRRLKGHKLNDQ